jgi:hypothetical protein
LAAQALLRSTRLSAVAAAPLVRPAGGPDPFAAGEDRTSRG